MKTLICRLSVLLIFMAVFGEGLAFGQTGGFVVDFKVSSPFSVGDATFPAGSYTARQQQDDLGILEISSADGQHSALVGCEPMYANTNPTKTELTFHKYGNSLFLKEIWTAGNTSGLYVIGGPQEKRARKSGKPTKVSVPANAK